jgi:hypothetical protein
MQFRSNLCLCKQWGINRINSNSAPKACKGHRMYIIILWRRRSWSNFINCLLGPIKCIGLRRVGFWLFINTALSCRTFEWNLIIRHFGYILNYLIKFWIRQDSLLWIMMARWVLFVQIFLDVIIVYLDKALSLGSSFDCIIYCVVSWSKFLEILDTF